MNRRGLRRPLTNVVTVTRGNSDRRATVSASVTHREPNGATGFVSVPPPGPAIPVTATERSTPNARDRALRHRARDRLAHGSLRLDQCRGHAEQRNLERVVVARRRRR